MSQASTANSSGVGPVRGAVGSVADAQTYKNLLYLFLSFPLGMVYFILAVTGLALGVGLSILGVGLAILFGTVLGVRAVAAFERQLANSLLGTDIADPDDVDRTGEGLFDTAKAYLSASSTWRGLGFVLLKFWIGVLSFVLLVTSLGIALELILLPVYPSGAFNIQINDWMLKDLFQTSTQRLAAVPLGVVLLFVVLPILNAFARLNGAIASSLLGPNGSQAETEPQS